MAQFSDNMRKQMEVKGYDPDAVELIEMRGKFIPELLGSYCEGMFKAPDGTFFRCGEGTTKSPYQKRAGLLYTSGTKLKVLSEEQVQEWLDNPVEYPGVD